MYDWAAGVWTASAVITSVVVVVHFALRAMSVRVVVGDEMILVMAVTVPVVGGLVW